MIRLNICIGLLAFVLIVGAEYSIVDDYTPGSFADKFTFFTENDPTHGYVNYVDRGFAERTGLYKVENNKVYIGVDHSSPAGGRGRNSVRLESKASYTHGLFIIDLDHMPSAVCGSWPAFWTVGGNWPTKGEIDIIEGVNGQTTNAMTLHTNDGCSIKNTGDFSGDMRSTNCLGNQGCSIGAKGQDTYGNGFNAAGGGVYATEWTSSFIKVWHFPRSRVPGDINSAHPNPANWGQPVAKFSGDCNIDQHFQGHVIVFDITFCGDWAGSVWSQQCGNKGPSCQNFVQNSPGEFKDVYWLVNSLKVYKGNGEGDKKVSLQCNNGKFVSSEGGSESGITCNRDNGNQAWEQFTLIPQNNNRVAIQANDGRYCSSENGDRAMRCDRPIADLWEQYEKIDNGDGTVSLKCSNGKFVSSEGGQQPMTCNRSNADLWEKFKILG